MAVVLVAPMLGVGIEAGVQVRMKIFARICCEAIAGEGHAFELEAIQIPALDVRTLAGLITTGASQLPLGTHWPAAAPTLNLRIDRNVLRDPGSAPPPKRTCR
jgi:hypothetical protein